MDGFVQKISHHVVFLDIPDHALPEAWPINYEEMVPYYERAESLYPVRGTRVATLPKC